MNALYTRSVRLLVRLHAAVTQPGLLIHSANAQGGNIDSQHFLAQYCCNAAEQRDAVSVKQADVQVQGFLCS